MKLVRVVCSIARGTSDAGEERPPGRVRLLHRLLIVSVTGGFFLLLTGVMAVAALVVGWILAALIAREAWWERPNARTYSIRLLVAFPLVLVAFAQLAGPPLTPPAPVSQCFEGTVGRDEQRDTPLAIDPRITTMEFRLRVPTLDDGAFRWWVTDPSGDIQWGGRAEQAGFAETSSPAPAGGQWTVSVRGETSRAEYAIEWLATEGRPLPTEPACP